MRASFKNAAWNLKTISLLLLTYHSYVMPVKHALINSEGTEAKNQRERYCYVKNVPGNHKDSRIPETIKKCFSRLMRSLCKMYYATDSLNRAVDWTKVIQLVAPDDRK